MQPPRKRSWINLAELKDQLIKKLGPERSKQYFDYLNRFLSLKLSKVEFNKLCLRTVGRDDISLHNQLIYSILKNACTRKVPPPTHDDPSRTAANKKSSDEAYRQNGSVPVVTQASSPLALLNGDILPPSPRKARTSALERRGGYHRSALGPNGKTNYASPSSPILQSGDFITALENGNSSSPDARKRKPQHQELMQQAENGVDVSGHHPPKFAAAEKSPDGLVAVNSKHETESLGRKNGKEVSSRTLLDAPLGIPYCGGSIGGARKASSLASNRKCVSVLDIDGLTETTRLRERMEQIAATQGLQGASKDCANALDNGLDAYLKGLIRSFAALNGARSGHEPTKNSSIKHQAHLRPINGVTPGHHYQMQSRSWPLDTMQNHEPKRAISLLDFRVAMELNPRQLGEDWPILLEKTYTHAFEE